MAYVPFPAILAVIGVESISRYQSQAYSFAFRYLLGDVGYLMPTVLVVVVSQGLH
jgi:DNA phosphorothioation-dependent restriction protein DptG